ncbi:hypothetical protein BUALT_Bualt07G0156500 [Buddleja alternifolia]|uniref:Disease resistance protein RGA3 n=1 Tax=Buddleja alternifolia TaxID=168488 RepID=A0AAV6XAF7_9LAMI|nr:hypothetical protein BUALT_Bualt07G0156500 [Buddleja alternifolia]
MADAIVSIVVEQLADIIRKQIQEEVNLVRGVKKEIHYLSSELKAIRNVLDDAERRGYKEKTIQHWLNKLEDTSYDIADVLDEWNYAILKLQIEGPKPKVCRLIPSSCLCFEKVTFRRDIAKKIKGLKKRMDMIVEEKARYDFIIAQPVEPRKSDRVKTTSLVDVSEIQGRAADKDALVNNLILEGAGQEERGSYVVSIVGTGGIGKTTLAQLVYNDDEVTNLFRKRIWVCVSDVSDEVKIVKGIIEQVTVSAPNLNELESLLKNLADSVSGQKFLLVLDDVWEEYCTKWEPLKNSLQCGDPGSKILVTTRSERVARMMGSAENEMHHLGQLSDKDCWTLMRRIAFSDKREEECEKFEDIGRKIANKCKGLPLAAKVLGSLLRFKDGVQEWENVLDSEIWQLEQVEVELFPHLFLSYNELSPAMKRCFSYCAVFPKDFRMDVEKLIKMWMAQGYLSSGGNADDLELTGKEYFDNLKARSLFQDFEESYGTNSCKMHDIVHDFAQFLRKNKRHTNMEDVDGIDGARTKELSQVCDPLLVSQIKVNRSLITLDILPLSHLLKSLGVRVLECAELPTEIEILTHLRYLDLNRGRWWPTQDFPQTMFKLYNLETLYLSDLELREVPKEIGNLIRLRHLDLSKNSMEELPETIYNLHHLRTLNLASCHNLEKLPEGIEGLVNLKHFINEDTYRLNQFPRGLEQLTSLRTLNKFGSGRGWSKFGYLNKLDKLSGDIRLNIRIDDAEDVIESQKAELRNKRHIQNLDIIFHDELRDTEEDESIRDDVMEALQPPLNLSSLKIVEYHGIKFPGWITSSLNHLTNLEFHWCCFCWTLPPLGKLPCLEKLHVRRMERLHFLGREFLGITSSSDDINASLQPVVIGFPKLKELSISWCSEWKEWEDITAEEEGSATVSIMPCLKKLFIRSCYRLTVLPHRLLRKASSLQYLEISRSPLLYNRYEDTEGSDWKSLTHIPRVEKSEYYL